MDDRYGINLYESFIASSEMTLPNADNDVLINLAYYNRKSIELVFLTRSEPAKSMSESVDDMY